MLWAQAEVKNFIQLSTGTLPPSPLNWEYTNETQEERSESDRLCELSIYIAARLIRQRISGASDPSLSSRIFWSFSVWCTR